MLEKSFGLFFYLKQSKNQKKRLRYIYLRITVDGVSKELSTKRQWDQSLWNQSAGRATGSKEDAKALNAYLDVFNGQVFQAKKVLMQTDQEITAEAIKNLLTGQSGRKRTILQAFKEHNDQIKSLSGRDYAIGTVNRYKIAYEHTASFIKLKYDSDDLELRELNYEFVSQFAYWLKSVRMCGHNSAMKYLKNFKKIVLECIKKDWLSKDPFVNFKTTLKEVIRVALTKEELGRIKTKLFENDRLNHVKDIFLFSCYTGLAYIDVAKLRQSDVTTCVDGGWWIISKRP